MSQSRIDFMRTMRLQQTTTKPTKSKKKKRHDAETSLFSEDEADEADEEEEAEEAEESTSSDDEVPPSIAGSTTGSSLGTKNFTKLGLNRGSSGIINHKILQ